MADATDAIYGTGNPLLPSFNPLTGAIPPGIVMTRPLNLSPGTAAVNSVMPGALDPSVLTAPIPGITVGADTARAQIGGINNQIGVAGTEGPGGAYTAAAGQAMVNAIDMGALAAKRGADQEALARFGVTPGAPNAVVTELSRRIMEMEPGILQQKQAISDKLHADFLDNPIQWLINQITVPFDIDAVNADISTRNDNLATLHALSAAAGDQVGLNATVANSASVERVDALNRVVAGTAAQQAASSRIAVASAGVNSVNTFNATNRQQFESAIQLIGVENTAAQLALGKYNASITYNREQLAQAQLDLANEDLQLKLHADRLATEAAARASEAHEVQMLIQKSISGNMAEKDAAKADLNTRLAAYATLVGEKPLTWDEVNMMGDSRKKAAYIAAVENPNFMDGRLGVDIASSYEVAKTFQHTMTPGMEQVRKQLAVVEAQVLNEAGSLWKTLTPDQQHIRLNTAMTQYMVRNASTVPDSGGLYSPASLGTLLSTIPAIAATKIGQSLKPLVSGVADPNGTYPLKANDVMTSALNMITAGQMTPSQGAEEVSRIYRAVAATNDQTMQYKRMAIPGMTSDNGVPHFFAPVATGGPVGGQEVIDLANSTKVENFLTRMKARYEMNVNPNRMQP